MTKSFVLPDIVTEFGDNEAYFVLSRRKLWLWSINVQCLMGTWEIVDILSCHVSSLYQISLKQKRRIEKIWGLLFQIQKITDLKVT